MIKRVALLLMLSVSAQAQPDGVWTASSDDASCTIQEHLSGQLFGLRWSTERHTLEVIFVKLGWALDATPMPLLIQLDQSLPVAVYATKRDHVVSFSLGSEATEAFLDRLADASEITVIGVPAGWNGPLGPVRGAVGRLIGCMRAERS